MTGRVLTLTPNPALDVWTTTEHFEAGPKLRCSKPVLSPGGGGINVSRVIHRLGQETCALYAAGGRTGEDLAAALEGEGVPAERFPISAATREDFSVREARTGDVLRFVTPGPRLSAGERDGLLGRIGRAAAQSALVVGSGSLPGGVGDRFWAEAAARCEDAGARFVLDSHDAVEAVLEKGVFCFRENRDAIAEIEGHDVAWPDGAADWAERQVRSGAAEIVIVTEGAEGAVLVSEKERLLQRPPNVEPESAIGAGDSFVAGLCLALSGDRGAEEALRLAVAAAAAALLTEGTELCRKEDVERLLSELDDAERI